MTTMRHHVEDDLQIACADYCCLTLHRSVLWWHTPNGGRRDSREAARLVRMGVRPGVPDFCFVWASPLLNGPCVGFIELKAPKGRLSESQLHFADAAQQASAGWELVRSLDQFIDVLKTWNVPTKAHGKAA